MKLPFDFGTKLIFRLGLPGLLLAITTAPLIFAFAHIIRVDVDWLEVLVLGTLFWGWLISLADMPIYMIYEGRRFWPRPFREWGLARERRRLARIQQNTTAELARIDRRLFLENSIELLNFALDSSGNPEVRFPTRIGNLITAYETHTRVKYGLDAIFYWPRLWVVLDKDLRDEVDNQQAIADSAVYTSFAIFVTAAILVCYAVANGVLHSRLADVPSPLGLLSLAAGCVGVGYAIYRVSLFAHAQFGELFKAVFDQHRKKLIIDETVEKVGSLAGDADALKRPEIERYAMVSRYLRWHRIRPPGEELNYTPEEWKNELTRRERTESGKSVKPEAVELADSGAHN
jgi:flagellar biosynthesis regulator FlaF